MPRDSGELLALIDSRRTALMMVDDMLKRIGDPPTATNVLFGLKALRSMLMSSNAHQYVKNPEGIPLMLDAINLEIGVIEGGDAIHRFG